MSKQIISNSKVDKLQKEIQKLIQKYSGLTSDENFTTYDTINFDKGFYLIFIKRDETQEKDKRLQISEFASGIRLDDLIASLSEVVDSHIGPDTKPNNTIDYRA